jgi:hypothetical protein
MTSRTKIIPFQTVSTLTSRPHLCIICPGGLASAFLGLPFEFDHTSTLLGSNAFERVMIFYCVPTASTPTTSSTLMITHLKLWVSRAPRCLNTVPTSLSFVILLSLMYYRVYLVAWLIFEIFVVIEFFIQLWSFILFKKLYKYHIFCLLHALLLYVF